MCKAFRSAKDHQLIKLNCFFTKILCKNGASSCENLKHLVKIVLQNIFLPKYFITGQNIYQSASKAHHVGAGHFGMVVTAAHITFLVRIAPARKWKNRNFKLAERSKAMASKATLIGVTPVQKLARENLFSILKGICMEQNIEKHGNLKICIDRL